MYNKLHKKLLIKEGYGMDLYHMKYFKKIAEIQNMTQAARQLSISQPSLSRMLKGIENELGASLFTRKGKSLELNAAGQIFLSYVNQILPLFDQARTDIGALSSNGSEITINMLYSNQILPDLVASFSKSFPNIKINISRFINDKTAESNCDIIIHASDNIASKTTSYKLMSEECLIGASRNHPFASLSQIPLGALKYEQFIVLNKDNILGGLTLKFFEDIGLSPKIAMECDNQSTVASFVALNLGIALFPSATWAPNSEPIVYKSIEGTKIYRSIYLTPTYKASSNASKIFIDYTRNYFLNEIHT